MKKNINDKKYYKNIYLLNYINLLFRVYNVSIYSFYKIYLEFLYNLQSLKYFLRIKIKNIDLKNIIFFNKGGI